MNNIFGEKLELRKIDNMIELIINDDEINAFTLTLKSAKQLLEELESKINEIK